MKDTYKQLAIRQHGLIMDLMERGLFPDIEPKDKKLKKRMKVYAKECLTSPILLKVINEHN